MTDKALDKAIADVANVVNAYRDEIEAALRKAKCGDIARELAQALDDWGDASASVMRR